MSNEDVSAKEKSHPRATDAGEMGSWMVVEVMVVVRKRELTRRVDKTTSR